MAQEEARLLDHDYIGTEHLLLGLIHEGEGIAAQALTQLGISLDGVRSQVRETIGRGTSTPAGHLPFTARSKKVLELSLREALQMRHNYIGTEHILLGLIREGKGVAAQVLAKLGADLPRVHDQVMALLSGLSGEGPPPSETGTGVQAPPAETAEAAGPAEHHPVCSHCGSSLADTAAAKLVRVSGPEGEDPGLVRFVYCGRCGTVVGTLGT